ncbi:MULTISPECIES: restriction endonuclease subunit S [unclassified Brevundimonas]|uniref:restriction endonuclease subunit S n=1 Tax=unclassified Brevundimonas TaxID=2622653 RepID=UPI0025BFBBD5|nr:MULTISPECIES: restriction endonuclease subunit S [unclassified Brevundimonas]
MSDVGFLGKLLDGAGVEWILLRDISTVLRGKRLTKSNLSDNSKFPVYHGGLAPLGFYGQSNRPANSTMIINVGASAGTVGYSEGEFWSSDGCYCIAHSESLNSRYLFHFLRNVEPHIKGKVRYAGIPTLDAIVLERLAIPIPCPDEPEKSLAIQREIVRILDTFTELTAELTAELATRKKQYNHYRDQLLTFEDGEVEWMQLGELTRIKTGQSVNKNMIADNPGQYPVINSGRDPLGFLDDWNTEEDPIGITSRGAGVGSVTWQEGRYFRGNLNYSVTIRSTDDLNVNFLYHTLEQFQSEIRGLCTFDGIPALNAVNLKKLRIPVPALAEQARIATILDKFDTLTTSLSEGLPREIALRQQQYEKYRDLLLSFPRPAESSEA